MPKRHDSAQHSFWITTSDSTSIMEHVKQPPTRLACKIADGGPRRFIGSEIDKSAFDIARYRLAAEVPEKNERPKDIRWSVSPMPRRAWEKREHQHFKTA